MATTVASSPHNRRALSPASPRRTRTPDMSFGRAASPVSPILSPSSPSLSGYSSSESEGPRRRSARRPSRSPQTTTSTLPIIRAHVELDPSQPEHADAPAAPSSAFTNGLANGKAVNGQPVVRRRRSSSVHAKPPPGVTPTKVVDWEIPRKTFHSSIGEYTSTSCRTAQITRIVASPGGPVPAASGGSRRTAPDMTQARTLAHRSCGETVTPVT